jgi:hypothetical protein
VVRRHLGKCLLHIGRHPRDPAVMMTRWELTRRSPPAASPLGRNRRASTGRNAVRRADAEEVARSKREHRGATQTKSAFLLHEAR